MPTPHIFEPNASEDEMLLSRRALEEANALADALAHQKLHQLEQQEAAAHRLVELTKSQAAARSFMLHVTTFSYGVALMTVLSRLSGGEDVAVFFGCALLSGSLAVSGVLFLRLRKLARDIAEIEKLRTCLSVPILD